MNDISQGVIVTEMKGWEGLEHSLEKYPHLMVGWKKETDRDGPVMERKPGESVM